MSESLIVQILTGIVTAAGAWAVMKTQLEQARIEISKLNEKMDTMGSNIFKVSVQVAYLNGQLTARGITVGPLPEGIKP